MTISLSLVLQHKRPAVLPLELTYFLGKRGKFLKLLRVDAHCQQEIFVMRKDVLTLLGCSGSLALTLLTGNSANANTAGGKEYVFTAPSANIEVNVIQEEEFLDCICTQSSEEANLLMDDETGENAIAQYGCDCAGCRRMVRNMIDDGSLSLPQ